MRTGNFARLRGKKGWERKGESARRATGILVVPEKRALCARTAATSSAPPSLRSSCSARGLRASRRLGVGKIPNFRRRFFHRAPVVPARRPSTRTRNLHARRAANNETALLVENRGTISRRIKGTLCRGRSSELTESVCNNSF